ncbi:MAG: hypothetical protein M1832_000154 [Thelocarpon impressellum]|nr:MAG: hypothetical protein M1832_000154 [Thelocarpon impressellum]
MFLPSSLVQSVLVAAVLGGQRAPVAADPLTTFGEWEAQDGARAECAYSAGRIKGSGPPMLHFRLALRGFGSREGQPGHGLLEQLLAAGLAPPGEDGWAAWPVKGTGSYVSCWLPDTAGAASGVEHAVYQASRGRVALRCHKGPVAQPLAGR